MSNVNGVFDVNLTESQTPRGLTETVFTETGRSQRYPSHARGIGRGSGDAGIPTYTSLGSQTVFRNPPFATLKSRQATLSARIDGCWSPCQ